MNFCRDCGEPLTRDNRICMDLCLNPHCINGGYPDDNDDPIDYGDPLNNGDKGDGPMEFTESPEGYRARERWAERYDDLDGAPEDDNDR